MEVRRSSVGKLEANCYVLCDGGKGVLVDPGAEPEKIEEMIGDIEIVGILVTHFHNDHIGALDYFCDKYNLKYNDIIPGFPYQVIETPGHSMDSLTFYFPQYKLMFTGDFLFQGTIGRLDLPGGNKTEMKKSLEKMLHYPKDIKIYPGHTEISMLGLERTMIEYYMKYLKDNKDQNKK